jgi:acyl carrier protein
MTDELIPLIAATLAPLPAITADTLLMRDLGCDGVDMQMVCMDIEDALGVALPEAAESAETVGDLAALVARARAREAV